MRDGFEVAACDEASTWAHGQSDDRQSNTRQSDYGQRERLPGDDRPNDHRLDWQTVDRALRTIARQRAALDADEARWLREAEALQIWRPLGMVSMIDYLERTLGYAPRTAQDRLRVARALGSLPALTASLASGALAFSAVRELTRVATPATERAWAAAAAGKNLRQVEDLVAHHRPGDDPDDPPDPEARMHVVRFELAAETFALLRQARGIVDDEHGTNLSDDGFVATLCSAILDGTAAAEPTGRAKHQVAISMCARCQQGWQDGGGVQVPLSAAAVDRAMCDAQHIGSLDGDGPERAHLDISPSVARFVWRRDGGRCRVPGCRSARGLELHHLVHRTDGGCHEAWNLVLACSSCHQAHHAGTATITGTAAHVEVHRRAPPTLSAAPEAPPDAHGGAAGTASIDPRHVPGTGASTKIDARREPGTGASAKNDPAAGQHAGVSAKNDRGAGQHAGASAENDQAAGQHAGASAKLDAAIVHAQTKEALIGLGWKPAVAHAAISAAVAAHGADLTLEQMIRASLRRCPVRRA